MFKKLFVTAVLCVGMLAMSGTQEAKAWPRISGWGLGLGSIICTSDWQGIGNTYVNPATAECTVYFDEVQVPCINNGGGTGGLGNPFYISASVTADDLLFTPIDGKGKAAGVKITFEAGDIYTAIFGDGPIPEEVCDQNDNWTVDPDGEIVVTEARVQIIGIDENGINKVELWGQCTLNVDAGLYDCTTTSNERIK